MSHIPWEFMLNLLRGLKKKKEYRIIPRVLAWLHE